MEREKKRGGERWSDMPAEAVRERPRWAVGCALGCGAMLLLGATLGLALGAGRRISEVMRHSEPGTDPELGNGQGQGQAGGEASQPSVSDSDARRAQMQLRYRSGPFTRIDSMVPSGQLMPTRVPLATPTGRSINTPWVVFGGSLSPAGLPTSSTGAPRIWHDPNEALGTPLTVLARTPAQILVRAADAGGGTDVMRYLVEFVGYEGHFDLPARIQTELGTVEAGGSEGAVIRFAIRSPIRSDGSSPRPGESFPVQMRIAAVDREGHVSAPIERSLSVIAVGAGDVEVTLTMDEPTDLDLYVTDPSGVTVYFGHQTALSGGHLDLDANAACASNMGVDNEHVYWSAGQAPAGSYRVHVAHYESCIQGRPVGYRLTVRNCGETVVLSGNFDGRSRGERCAAPGPGDRSWCQEVVRFEAPQCTPGSGP